ncbi:biotin-dependent carboxyltransferase family protein [Fusobacterium necrophorum subsp. funduliforme]
MPSIKVHKAGLCTTIQDIGRIGYQQFGIPVSGAMDEFAFTVANYLVERDKKNAVLEIQFLGPSLEFDFDVTIAITGANIQPKINHQDVKMWESIQVKKGDILSFGSLKSGIRTYLAFSAEIDVPFVMGSKSTLLKSKLGGLEGRTFKTGDIIPFKDVKVLSKKHSLNKKYIPEYKHHQDIRILLGPQDYYFEEAAIQTMLENTYQVTKDADRMGMRLAGEAIKHKEKADIISDAAVFGSIQVPGNGQPIILLADRQTTGGYTKIATVIRADLPKLAQMLPNDTMKFKLVTMEEAQREYKEFYKVLEEIKESFVVKPKVYTEQELYVMKKLFGNRRKVKNC